MDKRAWKTYAAWVLGTEAVGVISGLLTREGTKLYSETMAKPVLSPPAMVFPIAWTILYALMGTGAARIFTEPMGAARTRGLRLYFVQLGFNFLWSIVFFNLRMYAFAFFWLLAMWALILWMTLEFGKIDKPAAWMQVPYLAWTAFAAYLNFGVWMIHG